MKQATLKLAAIAILIGGTSTIASAQTNLKQENVITTAVPMLRISPDARSTGMGETGIATSGDAYSNFWNLGKIPFSKQKASIGVTYTPWLNDLDLKDVYLASLAGYYKLDDSQALSFGLRYFSLGDIQFTDQSGNNVGSNRPREFTVEGGYSRKLGAKSGLGIGVRYISSNLAVGNYNGTNYKVGTSVAADLHYFHSGAKENGEGFNYGVTLSNLGAKISYTDDNNQRDFIPANLGLGGAYTKVFDADSKITFALDLNKLLVPTPQNDSAGIADYRKQGVVSSWFGSFGDATGGGAEELKEVSTSIGAEYWYKEQFAFRAGYFYEGNTKGNRRYGTVGAGLKYNVIGLNLAYIFPSGSGINRNPLSNTIRFSLLFDMDKK
ncbi:MAG: type IX secretion system outer membrane channel protein PorV [Ferruginibacter sp.]|nr:type IX secretion system outer membrane channel protein PorV [Ferruginibacter sp.]